MITFQESTQTGYRQRTVDNAAGADATIAIAIDFNSAGERLTRNSVKLAKRLYLPININDLLLPETIYYSSSKLLSISASTLNIAGNGIYTFSRYKATSQEMLDSLVTTFIRFLIEKLPQRITLIRSGGQTGIDEAGLKAAVKLDIPALCLAPKGWLFRDINGKDIADEKLFKARFK